LKVFALDRDSEIAKSKSPSVPPRNNQDGGFEMAKSEPPSVPLRNNQDSGFEMVKSRISSVPRGEMHSLLVQNGQVWNPLCAVEKWSQ